MLVGVGILKVNEFLVLASDHKVLTFAKYRFRANGTIGFVVFHYCDDVYSELLDRKSVV